MTATAKKTLNIKVIRIDGGTQARTEINLDTVEDYAQAIKDGAKFPPVIVFFDGADYWLADGFHRYHGTNTAGATSIEAEVRTGTQRDAILFSAGANSLHGLRRSNGDKRKAVLMLLGDAEWGVWSDNAIAKQCGVSSNFVGTVRRSLSSDESEKPIERVRKDKHGNTSTIKTGNIGKATNATGTNSEPIAHATNTAPQPPATPAKLTDAEQIAQEAHGDSDPIALLEEANAELNELRALLQAAEANDQQAETLKWKRLTDIANRRQNELMETVNQREGELKRQTNWLRRIGTAMGTEDFSKLPALVEALARNAKVGAA